MVDVQFTIGFLDDDSNCVGDASAYPPVFLQYRQHKNDEWIKKWNTSDMSSNIAIAIMCGGYDYVMICMHTCGFN